MLRGSASGISQVQSASVLRGTLNVNKYIVANGGTLGTGKSQAEQTVNATLFQAAVAAAIAGDYYLEFTPDTVEIYNSTGVVVLPGSGKGFQWHGDYNASIIKQFFANAPILTIGDVTGSNQRSAAVIDGVRLSYGADQTGNTNADALRIGDIWRSTFRHIYAGDKAAQGFRPYRSCKIDGAVGAGYFSNTMEDCQFLGGQLSLLQIASYGTGNKFSNIYLQGGSSGAVADVTSPVLLSAGGLAVNLGTFDQMNIEWCKSQFLVEMNVVRGPVFNSPHFEGNQLTSADPAYFYASAGSQFVVNGGDDLDQEILAANSASGTASHFKLGGGSSVTLNGHDIWHNRAGVQVDIPFVVIKNTQDAKASIVADNLKLFDSSTAKGAMTNFRLSDAMTEAGYFPLGSVLWIDRFEQNGTIPLVKGGTTDLADADFTVYGMLRDFTIRHNSLTNAAARTATLSRFMGPPGSAFATTPTPYGNKVTFNRRTSGTYALLVNNWDGTQLASMNSNAENITFVFNGVNYQLSTEPLQGPVCENISFVDDSFVRPEPLNSYQTTNTATLATDTLTAIYCVAPCSGFLTQVSFRTSTSNASNGAKFKVGIYSVLPGNKPGRLIGTYTGEITVTNAATSTAFDVTLDTPIPVFAKMPFFVAILGTATTTAARYVIQSSASSALSHYGSPNTTAGTGLFNDIPNAYGWSVAQSYASGLPTSFGTPTAVTVVTGVPSPGLKYSTN